MKYWLLTIVTTTKNNGRPFVSNVVTKDNPVKYLQKCEKSNARNPERGEEDRVLFAIQLECASEEEFTELNDNWDCGDGLWL